MNGTLPLYEYRLGGVDTQGWWGHSKPTCCVLEHFALTGGWDAKTSPQRLLTPLGPLVPNNQLVKLSQYLIGNVVCT